MQRLVKLSRRIAFLAAISLLCCTSSGCLLLVEGFADQAFLFAKFWKTTPFIPVTATASEEIESTYWEEERYERVPILDPVEGEHAPLFCQDPPSDDEVMRALPDKVSGGVPFLAETSRNHVHIVTKLIVDRLDECRFYPMVGPARMHHCHYECTVFYEKVIRSNWPVPFTHKDETKEVVYIDHDHLIRCAGTAAE